VELQLSLAVMFVTSACIDILYTLFSWWWSRRLIRQEMAACKPKSNNNSNANNRSQYTYLEAQAKLATPYDIVEDMIQPMVNFAFVCSFTIVWPFMPVISLAYNVFVAKMAMYRRLSLSRRNFPASFEGLGVWRKLLRYSVMIACMINTLIAVFSMKPIKRWDRLSKFIAFVCFEHALFGVCFLIWVFVPDESPILTKRDEYNSDWSHLVLRPQDAKVECSPADDPINAVDIYPDAKDNAGVPGRNRTVSNMAR